MSILFRETFWGALIVLAGILLIVRNVFKIDLPVMGIIFPIIIITVGISLLTGARMTPQSSRHTMFNEGTYEAASGENSKYSVVFGKGVYDLRNIKPVDKDIHVDVSTVFGGAEIIVDRNTPLIVDGASVFGAVEFPNKESVSFGDRTYKSSGYVEGSPAIRVHAKVVFGGIEIIDRSDSSSY
jgi:predicted membrane protein